MFTLKTPNVNCSTTIVPVNLDLYVRLITKNCAMSEDTLELHRHGFTYLSIQTYVVAILEPFRRGGFD